MTLELNEVAVSMQNQSQIKENSARVILETESLHGYSDSVILGVEDSDVDHHDVSDADYPFVYITINRISAAYIVAFLQAFINEHQEPEQLDTRAKCTECKKPLDEYIVGGYCSRECVKKSFEKDFTV